MSSFNLFVRHVRAIATGCAFWIAAGIVPAGAETLTAGVALERMSAEERSTYILGIVEGLIYARFRKDTLVAGEPDQSGATCLREWIDSRPEDKSMIAWIDANFVNHPDHTPATIIYAMARKECGE